MRVLAAPAVLAALLALAHALPATGAGAAIRLAVASVLVLLLPGALVLRAFGWPHSLGAAIAGSFVLSIGIAGVALAAAFAFDGTLTLALATGGAITLVALAFAVFAPLERFDRSDVIAAGAVALAVLPAAAVVWHLQGSIVSDDLFHLGRVRKLEDLPALNSLTAVGEFRNGGLHPGYAFPLWHGIVAAIARTAGVDAGTAILNLGQVLAPLAAVLAYAVGRALFGSWAGGVATAAAQVALWAYQATATPFQTVSDPETAARALLIPALVVLVFTYVDDRGHSLLAPIATGGVALAVMHANYAAYFLLALAGYLIADLSVNRSWREAPRLAIAGGAVALPSVVLTALLWPVLTDTVERSAGVAAQAREFAHFAGVFEGTPDSFRLAPSEIARGAAFVCGLACVPLAAVAARQRWGAFVAGASTILLAVALTSPLFTAFADLMSLSQARRLERFLPLAIALAAAAVLAGRLRMRGVVAAAAAGFAFSLAYPEQQTYRIHDLGPSWPVWLALGGAIAGLAWSAWRRWDAPAATAWSAAAAVALTLPLTVAAFARMHHDIPDRLALTRGLVAELRNLPPGETVFASPRISYRIAAAAPLYVASAPLAHVAQTRRNRPFKRVRNARRFFSPHAKPAERWRILAEYGAGWVVVDRQERSLGTFAAKLRCIYRDRRYELYRVTRPGQSGRPCF